MHFYLTFVLGLSSNPLLFLENCKFEFCLKELTTMHCSDLEILFYCFAFAIWKQFQNQSDFSTITSTEDALLWFLLYWGTETSGDALAAWWAVLQSEWLGAARDKELWHCWSQPCPRWRLCQRADAGVASWREFINKEITWWDLGGLLAAALLDRCLFNNLLCVTVLGICWPPMWQAF